MSCKNEISIHPRVIFRFYSEAGDELLGCHLQTYTSHYNSGNMQKSIKAARSVIRHFLRKYRVTITAIYYTQTYKVEKYNDLPLSYAVKSIVTTEYLGQIGCEECAGERLWYWTYWHNGNMSEVHWRQEVNNT